MRERQHKTPDFVKMIDEWKNAMLQKDANVPHFEDDDEWENFKMQHIANSVSNLGPHLKSLLNGLKLSNTKTNHSSSMMTIIYGPAIWGISRSALNIFMNMVYLNKCSISQHTGFRTIRSRFSQLFPHQYRTIDFETTHLYGCTQIRFRLHVKRALDVSCERTKGGYLHTPILYGCIGLKQIWGVVSISISSPTILHTLSVICPLDSLYKMETPFISEPSFLSPICHFTSMQLRKFPYSCSIILDPLWTSTKTIMW